METSLIARFQAQVSSQPDAPALSVHGQTLSYAQLDQKARRLGAALCAETDSPQRVGVFAYKTETAYTGVLAALYAGSAFVPLNRSFPVERTREMIEQAQLDAVIVDAASAEKLRDVLRTLAQHPLIVLADADAFEIDLPAHSRVIDRYELEVLAPLESVRPTSENHQAYLLFTSGSTGRPKGVPIAHSSLLHFLNVNQACYQITSSDRLSQTFDHTFDLSVFDMFMAWAHGACLCVLQPADLLSPIAAIQRHGLTVWFSVPSVGLLLQQKKALVPNSMPTLRLSLFCGEALPVNLARAWQSAAPNSVIENLYGPTELTIACSRYRWEELRSPAESHNDIVPIGEIYPGLLPLVMDEQGAEVRAGEEGELCVAGPQTFPGYWKAPEQTRRAFWYKTGSDGVTRAYYRTGDRVRRDAKAGLIYLGRMDRQVKISGYRIELAEIECVIAKCSGVVHAIVIAQSLKPGAPPSLAAFVVGQQISLAEIEQRLSATLPAYMQPKVIHQLHSLPLNANGKINVKALNVGLQAN